MLRQSFFIGALALLSGCYYNVTRDQIVGSYQNQADVREAIDLFSDGHYLHKYVWHGKTLKDRGQWDLEGDNITLTDFAVCWKSCDLHEDVHPDISQTWFGIFINGEVGISEDVYRKNS
jgi:hypothetical protein